MLLLLHNFTLITGRPSRPNSRFPLAAPSHSCLTGLRCLPLRLVQCTAARTAAPCSRTKSSISASQWMLSVCRQARSEMHQPSPGQPSPAQPIYLRVQHRAAL